MTEETATDLVKEGDIAADYLETFLDIADLPGENLDLDVEGDRAYVYISGGDLTRLIGKRGEVLDSLQELTRLAVTRETGNRSRLMLDIDGHRARHKDQLAEIGRKAAEKALKSGESVKLLPMNPYERKVVHDAIGAAGAVSASEGEEPKRYIVVSAE